MSQTQPRLGQKQEKSNDDVILRLQFYNQVRTIRKEREYDLLANSTTLGTVAEILLELCEVDANLFGKPVDPWFFQILDNQYTKDHVVMSTIPMKIGYPFLFRHSILHKGETKPMCCDHVFMVSDVRLPDPDSTHDLTVLEQLSVKVY